MKKTKKIQNFQIFIILKLFNKHSKYHYLAWRSRWVLIIYKMTHKWLLINYESLIIIIKVNHVVIFQNPNMESSTKNVKRNKGTMETNVK